MSDTLAHYGVKGMRRGTRKSREERNAERRAKYEAKLKAKYGIDDVGKIENYLKKRKEHAEKVKNWRLANQRNRQLTATERREKYYGELDRGKLGKTYSTDATLAEAARKFYKKGHNKRMGHSELMHFGVKGMKWGVRKKRIKDAKRWTSKKQAKIDGMSDDQLRRINNRIRLEKEYRQLTQTRMERYRNKAGKAAEEAAFNTLQNVLQKGLKKAASQGGSAALKGAKRFKHSEMGMSDNIFFIDEDEVLAHHGVKGMRWGVRKQRPSGGAGPSKKRKGLSRKQKAAIAGVLGTAAAAGAGVYLHKSRNGKKIASVAKKQGAAAKKFASAAKNKASSAGGFAKSAASSAKGNARKAKSSAERAAKLAGRHGKKAGKTLGEMGRVTAGTAAFKAKMTAKNAKYGAQRKAWKAGNQARNVAKKAASTARGGAGGIKSAVKTATTKTVKQRPAPVNSLAKTTKKRANLMQVMGQVARENAKGAAVGLGATGALNVAARRSAKKSQSGSRRRSKRR
nr:MAG TPA: hypothetical protein [Siphovirus LN-2020-2]